MPLRLASRSQTRLKMLRDAGVAVETCATSADEDGLKAALHPLGLSPAALAQRLADAKALGAQGGDGDWVLSADQTLEIDGRALDKPTDLANLRAQIASLSGRTHALHAAACLARAGNVVWRGVGTTRLTMRRLSNDEIDRYVADEGASVLECVGGYRLEGVGVQLFEAVDGDFFTVLGLPLLAVLQALRSLENRS